MTQGSPQVGGRRPLAGPNRDRSIRARFPSTCEACRKRVEPGSVIAAHGGRWLHAACSAEREAVARAVAAELEVEEAGR